MIKEFIGYFSLYGSCLLEAALLLWLVRRGHARRLASVTIYLAALLTAGSARAAVLFYSGPLSRQYAYCFWFTDIALGLGAFLVICAFFRQASVGPEMWKFVRLFLAFVFVLVVLVSYLSLSRVARDPFGLFIFEFQQNLYFCNLVLNTLLYLLLQKAESYNDELNMLVCGFGLQFAGPAATYALLRLAAGGFLAQAAYAIAPLCDTCMILVWFYAIARAPKTAPLPASVDGKRKKLGVNALAHS